MPSKKLKAALVENKYYHIFNRGNNHEQLFYKQYDYRFFLKIYFQMSTAVIDTFTFCLLPNHFHFLIRVRENSCIKETASNQLRKLFIIYAMYLNRRIGRDGSLFTKNFRRIEITSNSYLKRLMFYIHFNPQKHGMINNFTEYPFSSYNLYAKRSRSIPLEREEGIAWFNDLGDFLYYHQYLKDEWMIRHLILED